MNSSKKFVKIALSAALSASLLLPSAFALYPAKVKADALYLRATPGGDIIGTLSQGTTVAIINNSQSWYKIAVNGKEGYVSGEYVVGTSYGDFLLGSARIKCDTTVNLREATNTSCAVLASMPNGASVRALGVYNGWYKITYNGKTGYVHPDYVSFSGTASQTTPSSAPTSAATTTTTTTTSSTGSASSQKVLDYAAQFLGTPYVYGGSSPSGFDCSGFTSYVYKNTVTSIPRVAQAQYDGLPHVSRSDLQPGDLVFFGSSTSSISHVGIYVGNNTFIHSPHTGEVVKYDTLTGTYDSRFQGAARVITG